MRAPVFPCAIGRAITHPDPDTFPGFQQPCDKSAFETLTVADGLRVHHHEVCSDHMREMWRRNLISEPLGVPR